MSTDLEAAIVINANQSIYFSHFPSRSSSQDDIQLLYNSFLWVHQSQIEEISSLNQISSISIPQNVTTDFRIPIDRSILRLITISGVLVLIIIFIVLKKRRN